MRGRLAVVVLVVAIAAFLLSGGAEEVKSRVSSGSVVGRRTKADARGIILDDPRALAAEAGLDLETYALARMIASEHGSDPDVYCEAVAWAIRNKARERKTTIFGLLTERRGTAADGLFGEQGAEGLEAYASTIRDPRTRHEAIAKRVVAAPQSQDITGGATHFFSPQTQDWGYARGKYSKSAAQVDASWRSTGLYSSGAVPVAVAGIDPRTLTLYRRAA